GTTRISGDTRTTGRSFYNVAEIVSDDPNASDTQRCAASVGQSPCLPRTNGAPSLISKVHARRSQLDDRACAGQRDNLWAVSCVICDCHRACSITFLGGTKRDSDRATLSREQTRAAVVFGDEVPARDNTGNSQRRGPGIR